MMRKSLSGRLDFYKGCALAKFPDPVIGLFRECKYSPKAEGPLNRSIIQLLDAICISITSRMQL